MTTIVIINNSKSNCNWITYFLPIIWSITVAIFFFAIILHTTWDTCSISYIYSITPQSMFYPKSDGIGLNYFGNWLFFEYINHIVSDLEKITENTHFHFKMFRKKKNPLLDTDKMILCTSYLTTVSLHQHTAALQTASPQPNAPTLRRRQNRKEPFKNSLPLI